MSEKSTNQVILIKAAIPAQLTIIDINVINEISNYVNKYRDLHGVPHLMWDGTIANFSQQWSNYLLANNMFAHSGTQLYGENLAYFQGYGIDMIKLIKMAIDLWYEEIKLYDFNKPGFSESTGHATCLLWKSSTKFGVGFAMNSSKQIVDVVFNTSPPGNVLGRFKENVLPLINDPVLQNPCPPCTTSSTTPNKLPKTITIKTPSKLPVMSCQKCLNKSKNKDFFWEPWYECDHYCFDSDSDSSDSSDDDYWDDHWDHDWDHDRNVKLKSDKPKSKKSKSVKQKSKSVNLNSYANSKCSFDKLTVLKELINSLGE